MSSKVGRSAGSAVATGSVAAAPDASGTAPHTSGTAPDASGSAPHTSTSRGLVIGLLASLAFATSGALIKPLLEAGWSPAAAVTVRAGIAGLALVPFALVAMRGRWSALWRARWRVLGMALIGVAGTQLAYFAAISRIPVSTALLIEYLAPLLLVALVWVRTRRAPRAVVLVGSVLAIGGLVLVIGPSALAVSGGIDALGLVFALIAMVGVAGYYLIAARPNDGLPPVAFAASGLIFGSIALGVVGLLGVVPFTADFGPVLLGSTADSVAGTVSGAAAGSIMVPWWVPLGFVALVGTAFAYVASIAASQALGSRLMSFVGLLEVVFASLFAWLVIGEAITPLQGLGGVLILGGIALVRMEREADANVPLEPGSVDEDAPLDSAPLDSALLGPATITSAMLAETPSDAPTLTPASAAERPHSSPA